MRISDAPFLRGLSFAERSQIVSQAVAHQGVAIRALVDDVFRSAAQTVDETVRPLRYWAALARENARAPSATPIDFWASLEQQRRRADELLPAGIAPPGTGAAGHAARPVLRAGVVFGLTPVEMARGGRRSTAAPAIGAPPPLPIRTVSYRDLVTLRSETVSPAGRLIDLIA